MKRWLPLIVIVGLLALLVFWGIGVSNTMVEMSGNAQKQWANVESAYQRRSDLIGNLVKTVQGAADFERGTLKDVIEARAKATSVNIDASNLNAENMAQFQEAQAGLSSALSRLLVSVERYPDLKANQNFLELQSQIEGTENRINVERNRFNETAGNYNIYIRKIPKNLVASIAGHEPMALFKADQGAEKAPNVEFNFK
ncbi:LemA family protein [Capnocytophaga canimorsus]|uniref:LemA family protein n=1 Tax=Capnocytophaga canimorsus (strain 5) TaxID=860228 RepID=F9YR67_CAPCC|nr:LemA family protein [Capnocytophaga canimorsus]AEK22425.1 hypothetical protein Ccan_03030 [Capnocytophaga canimorsus Cc5]